ncbi:MAG TPA: sugar transferase [Anaerolineae bacterium]|nr:sugar transferase [Anaerolineae bacterium]
MTRVARLLRRLSLDALPQVLNVLIGDLKTLSNRFLAAI